MGLGFPRQSPVGRALHCGSRLAAIRSVEKEVELVEQLVLLRVCGSALPEKVPVEEMHKRPFEHEEDGGMLAEAPTDQQAPDGHERAYEDGEKHEVARKHDGEDERGQYQLQHEAPYLQKLR